MASHYVARELLALGHEVKQVPPAYAIPFRQGHKNDFRDAHAVAEAVLERPSTRCVPTKTDSQLDLQALHRVRYRLIGNRTAVINQIRGFLLEHGVPVRQGHRFLRQQLPQILATRADVLSPRIIRIIAGLIDDWKYLDERIARVTDEIETLARADESCGCARISVMARSKSASFKGRIQKRKTNYLQIIISSLQRTAGPYTSAITGRKQLQQRAALFDRLVARTIVMPGAIHRIGHYWIKFVDTAKYKIKPQAIAINTNQIAIFPILGTRP
jgi:Transposase